MDSLFLRIFFPSLALAIISAGVVLFPFILPQIPFLVALPVAFVFSIVFSWMLSRSITRPVTVLVKAAKRIAAGDRDIKINIQRTDEIGWLARFFNAIAVQFHDTRERGQALSQIKSQFITVAAHQLRTPLSALKWSLRLILDGDMGDLGEKQREFLQQSYQTNEHLIHLINDFLDISRIEEGKFGFQFKKVRILDTIQKAVDESLAQAALRGVHLSFESRAPKDIQIIADENRIYTVMANILDNAVRYSNKGNDVAVQVSVEKEGNMLEVRVTDSGIGIPADEQKKIFSRFYRATNAMRQQTEGSGLGLFIAKNIIERHGGTIGFVSEENKGTTVFFTLPAKEDFIKIREESFFFPEIT